MLFNFLLAFLFAYAIFGLIKSERECRRRTRELQRYLVRAGFTAERCSECDRQAGCPFVSELASCTFSTHVTSYRQRRKVRRQRRKCRRARLKGT